jgi:hypothetical protein
MILVFLAQEIIFIAIMAIFIQSETVQDPGYTRDYFGYVLLAVSIGFTLFLSQLVVFHTVLRLGIGRHVTTYMCVLWYRGCKQKKKELSEYEYNKWQREMFELPIRQDLNQSDSLEKSVN